MRCQWVVLITVVMEHFCIAPLIVTTIHDRLVVAITLPQYFSEVISRALFAILWSRCLLAFLYYPIACTTAAESPEQPNAVHIVASFSHFTDLAIQSHVSRKSSMEDHLQILVRVYTEALEVPTRKQTAQKRLGEQLHTRTAGEFPLTLIRVIGSKWEYFVLRVSAALGCNPLTHPRPNQPGNGHTGRHGENSRLNAVRSHTSSHTSARSRSAGSGTLPPVAT